MTFCALQFYFISGLKEPQNSLLTGTGNFCEGTENLFARTRNLNSDRFPDKVFGRGTPTQFFLPEAIANIIGEGGSP
jgi:hypothetical protein